MNRIPLKLHFLAIAVSLKKNYPQLLDKCESFNKLMMIIINTKKYPELNDYLEKYYLPKYPGEINYLAIRNFYYCPIYLAFHTVKNYSSLKTVEILLKFGAQFSLSYLPDLCKENMDLYLLLIKNGLDINFRDGIGKNILSQYLTNKVCDIDLIKFLMDQRANINSRSNHDNTPLMFYLASEHSNDIYPIVNYLITNGANIHLKNRENQTVLHIACAKNADEKVIQLLIDYGFQIDHEDIHGNTALIYLANSTNKVNIFRILLKLGANPNHQSKDGSTPLISLSRNENIIPVLKLLLDYGADLNIINKKGESFISIICNKAKDDSHYDIIEFVLSFQKIDLSSINWRKLSTNNNPKIIILLAQQEKEQKLILLKDKYEKVVKERDFYYHTINLHPEADSIKELWNHFKNLGENSQI